MKPMDLVLDLSHWETVTSWEEIKAAGYGGIIYKGSEGTTYVDDTYAAAKEGAEKVGLCWGCYHFLRPGDLKAQARFYIKTVGKDLQLYCADHEDPGVTLDDLKDFLDEVHKLTGHLAVLYSGHVIKEQLLDGHDEELARHRLWIAHYTDAAAPTWPTGTWPTWWLWQYTEDGVVPGIADATDINRFQGTALDLKREWNGKLIA